jgi:hypothetical protein
LLLFFNFYYHRKKKEKKIPKTIGRKSKANGQSIEVVPFVVCVAFNFIFLKGKRKEKKITFFILKEEEEEVVG